MSTIQIFDVKENKVIAVDKIEKSEADWKKLLNKQQFEITTKKGTEPPFSREYREIHDPGIFRCVRCETDLFLYSTKFDSGTGWPSFYQPVSPLNTVTQPDNSFGQRRTEVLCARCGSHLGHVFDDGPPPTGKRYCMNGWTLKFVPIDKL
jgi:peptide-methionine (R)-S-oxide reductase